MAKSPEPALPIIAADAGDAADFSDDRSRARVNTEYEYGAASAASAAGDQASEAGLPSGTRCGGEKNHLGRQV
jgi:hypothetical protein